MTRHCDETPTEADAETRRTVRIALPFKDQKSADAVRKQLKDLSKKIETELQPVYTSPKIGDKLKLQEEKLALESHQCVVYICKCDLCDADYKQLLDEVVVISGIIKVEVSVISRSRRLRLITLTETLIIPDITKTESNNGFIVHCFFAILFSSFHIERFQHLR